MFFLIASWGVADSSKVMGRGRDETNIKNAP